ncbi:Nicotinamide-nucleotide amidohydrolase PncC [Desulfovibrionales bacterium]
MITFASELIDQVKILGSLLLQRGWRLGTAESCTGGLVAGALTAASGSSAWFVGGMVAYTNALKTSLLGVSEALLAKAGAVSEPVVLAMAAGARTHLNVETSLAISGVAGPTGGTPEKPIGTVWIAWSAGPFSYAECFQFPGDRHTVRATTVITALNKLLTVL